VTGHVESPAVLENVPSYDLLHILTCATCRSWLIGKLLDQGLSPDPDDTLVDYEPVFAALLEKNPEILAAANARRDEAGRLFEELMALPPGKRLRAVKSTRFHSVPLLDRLLEACHAAQIPDPRGAADLGLLACRLGQTLGRQEEDAYAAIPRALALAANARRLHGALKSADQLLAKGAGFLRDRVDRAFHCRIAGLVRWEAGRTDEGAALLDRAVLYYAAEDLVEEQGATLALVGLLEEEEGQTASALSKLLMGWTAMDRQARPGFAVRVGLALAFCLAGVEQGERARSLLREVWQLSSAVKDVAEWHRLYWAEARVLGRLGQSAEAMEILASVREKLDVEGNRAEAVLVGVDYDLLVAEAGRLGTTELLKTLHPTGCAAAPGIPEPRLRDLAALSRAELRRAYRLGGRRLKPLPFA
jgi:tetratricopeptide (TPR) repeat protein